MKSLIAIIVCDHASVRRIKIMNSFQLAAAEFLLSYTFKVRSQLRLYCKYRTLNNIKTIKTPTKFKNFLQKVSKHLVFITGRLLRVALVVRKV